MFFNVNLKLSSPSQDSFGLPNKFVYVRLKSVWLQLDEIRLLGRIVQIGHDVPWLSQVEVDTYYKQGCPLVLLCLHYKGYIFSFYGSYKNVTIL